MSRVEYKVEYIGESTDYKPYIIYSYGKGVVASFYNKDWAERTCDELNAHELLKSEEAGLYPKLRGNND